MLTVEAILIFIHRQKAGRIAADLSKNATNREVIFMNFQWQLLNNVV